MSEKKGATCQSFIRKEITTYRIGTLKDLKMPKLKNSNPCTAQISNEDYQNLCHKTTKRRLIATEIVALISLGCEIFGLFLLSFPQNERKIYWFCSVCKFFEGSVFTLISLINVEPTLTNFEKFHPPQSKNPPS